MTYKVTYHFGPGISVSVDRVAEKDIEKIDALLAYENKVFVVSGKHTTVTQYIPVRSVLFVEVQEEKI